ncbi:hypothetical protein CVT26_003894 [Gymnopilus dilepis]|uniref:Uncharacterized protein n=1 Tax=Gymnopilus dilepis TaxID=231916 RepID=A0A409WYG2_9AGAR|nr:hypothetical protein CVT26_003894 [Gymnopilus dilepis]
MGNMNWCGMFSSTVASAS